MKCIFFFVDYWMISFLLKWKKNGMGLGKNVGLERFCQIVTLFILLLLLGVSMLQKHMYS